MASGDSLSVKVCVEATLHVALREFAQKMFDKYGVQIRSANLDWVETVGGAATAYAVNIDTKTSIGWKPQPCESAD